MLKRILPVFAALLVASCSGNATGSTEDGLRVVPAGEAAITVTNLRDGPVYYRIINPRALASWAPCTSPADCPEIGPGETVRIEYAEIGLYSPDSMEAQLLWWQFARADGGGYRTVRQGDVTVRL
ncbi:MAG TPA: hypothetical protein VF006_21175 [Longimicrobium sp.]